MVRAMVMGVVVYACVGVPMHARGAEGGPDSFGYVFRDQVDGGPTFNYEIGAGAQHMSLADDAYSTIPLPFPFDFYGVTYNTIDVHSNGGLSFGATEALAVSHDCPIADLGQPTIAVYQTDLVPGSTSTGVFTWTGGSTPERYFVIEWFNVPLYNLSGEVTFEAKLFEADHHIELHFDDTDVGGTDSDAGRSAAVGLWSPVATLQLSCDVAAIPDNYAVGFYPPPPCLDGDGDGFLDAACGGDDCDDLNPGINPAALEICDDRDTDCDGTLPPAEQDNDGDGWTPCNGDCDDDDAGRLPVDLDGDGFTTCEDDCDDNNDSVHPTAPELCDRLDNDCDGSLGVTEVDQDGDGQFACEGDCDDNDPAVYSGHAEICDAPIAKDNDCDGVIDEGLSCETTPDGDDDDTVVPEGQETPYGCILGCSVGHDRALPPVGTLAGLAFLMVGAFHRRRRPARSARR